MNYRILPVTPFQQNCSLLWCERTGAAALIDPGGEAEYLLDVVERAGLILGQVLLTHGHLDHVGAACEIARRLRIPIMGPQQQDDFLLQTLPQQAQMFGFPAAEVFVPDQWLNHGDTVTVGKVTLSVLHCPGHTPGHVAFYDQAAKTAFVGDVLFHGSIGRTDLPRGDHAALIDSILNTLLPLGDDVTFVPGHGPVSTLGEEKANNPFIAGR